VFYGIKFFLVLSNKPNTEKFLSKNYPFISNWQKRFPQSKVFFAKISWAMALITYTQLSLLTGVRFTVS